MTEVDIETIVLHVENDSDNLKISLDAAINPNIDLDNQYRIFTKRINTLQQEFYGVGNVVKELGLIKKEISGVYQNYTERTKSVK